VAGRRWRAASDCFTLALHALKHGSAAAPLPFGEPTSAAVGGALGGGAAVGGALGSGAAVVGLLSGRAEARLHLRLP
jgi:hypothetical protein